MRNWLKKLPFALVRIGKEKKWLKYPVVILLAIVVAICEIYDAVKVFTRPKMRRRIMATALALCMTFSLLPATAFAAAANAPLQGGCSCPVVDSGTVEHGEGCTLNEAQKPDNSEKPETPSQSDCTCPPVDSGELTHGTGCPLYEKLVPEQAEAVKAVLALIAALPTMAELEAVDTEGEGFADYLAKLRLDTAAARSAYDALTDEQKASFDPAALEKLTALEAVLAAMPVPMADTIPMLSADANNSYQNVLYELTNSPSKTATVSGVVSKTAVTGIDNALTIPTQVQNGGTVYDVTAIKDGAFSGTSQLKAVTVPASVTTIGNTAFKQIASGAVVTLLHTTCPTGINKDSFLTNAISLLFINATPAVAAAVGDTYDNDYYGIFVTNLPVPDFNNSNSSLKLARAQASTTSLFGKGGYTVFGIKSGYDIQTTYENGGYATYLSTEASPSKGNSSMVRLPGEGAETYVKSGIWAKAESEFVAGGKYLRITYTMRNSTNAAISNVSLGVNADVQIGEDDNASIYPTPTGFRLVNTKTASADPAGSGMQFTLNCTNSAGADDVSTMWYGSEIERNNELFTNLPNKTNFIGTDSGLAFSWKDMSIPANESISRSVVFGVGEKAEPPALPPAAAGDPTPIALYLTATGQKDITVNAKVKDETGVTDTLYYTINGGEEKTLGDPVTATGSEQVIAGVIGAENFTADGTYTVKLWIMNSKGAMSEVITKVLNVDSGTMGGAGLEQGGAPTPPPPPATCTCIAPGLPSMFGDQTHETSSFPNGWDFAATGSAVGGNCAVADHKTNQITYTYSSVSSTGGNTPTFDKTGFSFPAAGVYTIKCVASANGKETTGTATFTITAPAPVPAKITITVTKGTETKSVGGDTLEKAVNVSGLTPSTITKLTITGGEVTADDWTWLKTLTALTDFTIDASIADGKVVDIPNGSVGTAIFPKSIKSVNIPQAITVGDYAFKECKQLKTVSLLKATSIGDSAFNACTSLTEVSLPVATSIGRNAFEACTALISVSLPVATTIGSSAFYRCTALTDVNLDKATSIGGDAFSGCTALTEVSLPVATTIGNGAFYGCKSLTTISLPVATTIEQQAFNNCSMLTSVSLPKATQIGSWAFGNCSKLATLKLGAAVPTSVDVTAFNACTDKDKLVLVGTDGSPLTESTTPKLSVVAAAYDKKVSPDTGTDTDGLWFGWKIGGTAAPADKITITVTKGTETKTDIGGASLSDAITKSTLTPSAITKLTITGGEVTADDWVWFKGGTTNYPNTPVLSNLTDFTIANTVADNNVAPIPNGSSGNFIFPQSIKSVSIPQAITVGDYAFTGRLNLATVNLDNATSIGDDAFSSCISLKTASFPAATSIGVNAFNGCTGLTTISLPAAITIGNKAFSVCTSLDTVSLPKATSIDVSAFISCTALKSVSLPVATTIGKMAFNGCTKLATLKLGAKVPTSVNGTAFNGCPKITLTFVQADGTTELTESTNPKFSVVAAAYDAVDDDAEGYATDGLWYGWKIGGTAAPAGKITITVTDGTTTKTDIGGDTLAKAVTASKLTPNKITKLTITGGEVTTADWSLLKTLTKLTDFTIDASIADNKVAPIPNGSDATPIFPESIVKATIPQAIAVGDYAFAYCKALTTVSLPKATKIGGYAFISCTALKSVSLPKATSIGELAFQACNALTTVELPEVTSINKLAFSACKVLASVSLPKVTRIDDYAFKSCPLLTTLKLTATPPTTMGSSVFTDCPTDRSLVLMDANGSALTGSTLTTAQSKYKAANDDNSYDDLWYGWKLGDSGVNVAVTGVTLNKPALSLAAGKSETLVATIAPANASNKAVTWRTSNTGIATVDENGKVTAVAVGSATITVTTTDGGKTATCAVTVTAAAASKPAPGGVLTAPLTQDKVDDVFGEGNATLDNNAKPPKITIGNSITVENPIEIKTDVTIDLGGNTITGKPGQPPIIVGENDKVTVGGDGTVAGGDNSSGTGGNGITGGTGSDITIGGGVTVEGGDGTTGGDGINSGGNVTVGGDVNGGNGSAGNGGDGVDTSTGGGNITIKPDGSANGGDSTGGNGNGGNGTSSGGNTIVGGDVTGGNGNGSGSGGNGATDTAGGSGNITVQPGGSSTGGNGGSSGGAGGDGVENNGGGSTTVGGDATGGTGGNSSSGTGGAGGNGSASNGNGSIDVGGSSTGGSGGNGATGGAGGSGTATGGDTTISGGGSATGGNGGTGTTGGNGGDGADSGSITVGGGGTASGGNGGTGTATGGSGGDGSDSSGEGTINGGVSGGNGGSGGSTGGSGGNGAASGTGDIDIGGSASGGNGGSGGTTGGTGGNGTTTGGDINVSGGGSSTGGNGGSSSTIGGNGGNGTDTSGGGTTVDGSATGGNGGHGTGSSGSGGTGGNGANQGGGSVNGSGTATGGNGGNGTETGVGGNGGAGVGGGASVGSVTATGGKNGLKAITKVDDSKAGTTVTVPDKSTLADAALTPAEKKDKDITEVSVTLNIEKKNDQPNKAEVEKVLSSAPADIIGAFFDITLEKIITKGGSAQSPVNVSDASDEIEITITIPNNMRDGSNYVVIRVHNGVGEALPTDHFGDNLTFKTDKFSTYAIAYTKQGGITPPSPPNGNNSGGGSSGGSTGNEEAFWKNTAETVGGAKKGDVIKINAGNYDKIPSEVMDILRKNDITVVIEWNNGETITIPAGKAPKAEAGRVFYPLSLLAEMYKNVKFVNTETVVKPQGGNPETGGPGYIEYADGKTTAVTGKVVQAANAPQAENATTANGANSGETVTQKAVTPPTAGFEADAFAGTPDTQQTNDGNAFATIALMLAALAVGSGVWLWGKKHENEKSSKM